MRALQALSEQHNTTESQRKSELGRLLSERVQLTAAVEAARAGATAASAQAAEHEAALNQRRAKGVELEATLAAERKRATDLEAQVQQLDAELATLRKEMDDWGETVRSAHQERGTFQATLAAAESRAREAERRAAEQADALLLQQSEATSHAARIHELEADLTAAEEAVHRLESDARKKAARVEELEKAQQARPAPLSAHDQDAETSANPALSEGARSTDESERAVLPLPDGALRLLIYQSDGHEVVHVLARKTSIGRTPDNDLQIDAKFVSRHHAVVLAGPAQTIVEDLNSTNGVQVNGRRVTRHTLQDGDVLAIGRQQYRFAIRKAQDKR